MTHGKFINNKIALYFISVCIVALIYMRDVLNISVNKNIFLALIIFFIFLMKDIKISIALFCFLIPFLSGLPGNYIVISYCILLLWRGKLAVKFGILAPIIVFLILELLHVMYYSNDFLNMLMYASYFLLIVMIFSLKENIDIRLCIMCFGTGSLLSLVTIFIISLNYVSFADLMTYRYGNVLDLTNKSGMILTQDQDFIGYLSIVGISTLMLLFNYKPLEYEKHSKTKLIILIVGLLFFGILTLSRAFVLTLLVYILLYIWSNGSLLNKKNLRSFILFILIAVCTYIIISKQFPDIIDAIVKRFTSEEISGGRDKINAFYLDKFLNNIGFFFVGTGVQTMTIATNYVAALHSAGLQLLVGTGIFGSFIFIIWVINIVNEERKKISKKLLKKSIVPLIVSIIIVQSMPTFAPYIGLLPMVIPALAFRLNDRLQ